MEQFGLSIERYAEIENIIYEAAVIPEKWPEVLQNLSEVGEGLGAVMFSVNEWRTQWTASAAIHPMMQDFVESGWATKNTRMSNGLRKGLHLLPRFVTETDYYEPGEIETDLLNQEFFRPHGVGASAGIVASLPHGDLICFSVEKAIAGGPMSKPALANLDSLRPHLVRAAMMTARLGLEQLRTAVETLALLGFAAAAVDRQGKVVVANPLFNVASASWTTRGGDRIALNHKGAGDLLQTALDTIASANGVRSIPLREGDAPLRHILHVLPVRRQAFDLFTNSIAILVITSPSDKVGSAPLLQALFDLTPAEAVLAQRIGKGQSIEEIALNEGRSALTLRSQLKNVLAKTGCKRQAELASMLTSLLPPAL